jgi:hypothetical protein
MNRNLVGSIYGRSSIKITHIIPIKNPETQATLDTQHRTKTKKTINIIQKTKMMRDTDPTKK